MGLDDELKYVIVEDRGHEMPIIFPALMEHAKFIGLRPVSAGFVSITGQKGNAADDPTFDVSCWGKSVSLGVAARQEDASIIKRELERPHRY